MGASYRACYCRSMPDLVNEKQTGSKHVDALFTSALFLRASDIHIDPTPDFVLVRFRIDGDMVKQENIDKQFHSEIIGRIKALAKLPTDEHRRPLDGRFKVVVHSNPIDIRVSITPSYHGESVVMRLLQEIFETTSLEKIGISGTDQKHIEKALKKSSGMILTTGPTGSGKTTTLYTIVKQLRENPVSIITIEDPIEYSLSGVRQVQVNNNANLSFAQGLRSIVRQDPDIVMVGEIRDTETAKIAVNTALTGHLLLSTLHTIDATSAIARLIDMEIEPYLIASTLELVIAQRLVRTLCTHCKISEKIKGREKDFFNARHASAPSYLFRASTGCDKCNKGYFGRLGIYELLCIDDEIRNLISTHQSIQVIKTYAITQGMRTLSSSLLQSVAKGYTSLAEFLHYTNEKIID